MINYYYQQVLTLDVRSYLMKNDSSGVSKTLTPEEIKDSVNKSLSEEDDYNRYDVEFDNGRIKIICYDEKPFFHHGIGSTDLYDVVWGIEKDLIKILEKK